MSVCVCVFFFFFCGGFKLFFSHGPKPSLALSSCFEGQAMLLRDVDATKKVPGKRKGRDLERKKA